MSRRLAPSPSCLPALAVALALAVPSAPAAAQTAQEVVAEALQRHEQRMEGVQSYTVVQEVMGFETTTTYQRRTVDGHTVFVPEQTTGSEAAEQTPQSYQATLAGLGERATHAGTESVDGMECHVLELTDFSGEGLSGLAPPEADGEWTPERMRMYLDTDRLLPRKMIMEGTTTVQGEKRPVVMTALLRDYREVDGVVHPFRMQIRTEGLTGSMSPEERERLRKSLEEMRAKMDEMPQQQREMMEKMMGGKMEKMEQMLASGAMDFTARVKELRVNQGGGS